MTMKWKWYGEAGCRREHIIAYDVIKAMLGREKLPVPGSGETGNIHLGCMNGFVKPWSGWYRPIPHMMGLRVRD